KVRAAPFFIPAFNDKKVDYGIPGVHLNDWVVFNIHSNGLYGETVYKLCFSNKNSPVHVPVVIDEYFESTPYYFFLEHPVYGPCCFVEVEENGRKKIRMYKMSDIQAEIDKYLLEKAKSAISKA
ncbi:MAG: hypothetical protein IJP90_07430, partial [Treponema sp.]|nr:hypothetical protein [Treponema sp.]